ncbi:hypothetical protein Vadar_019339 [Vaccinium darrowii]|uniref:Uncharacterized protein n=1 Tax=Vaccinium darrowii TaxID=229202 RepID=A0ACB7ZC71_9ERIC|nr:hypothetical protein Vadar_019339 [Vaccinium darrowii]
MGERNRSPPSVGFLRVHVQLHVSLRLLFDLVRNRVDVLEIRFQNPTFVLLFHPQNKILPDETLSVVNGVRPRYPCSEKLIVNCLIIVEAENDVVGFFAGEEVCEVGVLHRSQRIHAVDGIAPKTG